MCWKFITQACERQLKFDPAWQPEEGTFCFVSLFICKLILSSVSVRSTKLVYMGHRIEWSEIVAVLTFVNQDFCDILYNQVSLVVTLCHSLTHSVQISSMCEHFRVHIWRVVNSAIYTTSNPPN